MASAVSASHGADIMRPRRSRANMRDARSMRRVIIKQGYLRKMPNSSKLGASFKKPELRWFIFGVINSAYPYLEYYESEECIFTSTPRKTIFLDNCLYLTRNQRTSRHNHVFTLVMRDRSLSLVASNRDTMNEWCRAIEDKLHTLHIIDTIGGDNDYVKVPTRPRHSIAAPSASSAPQTPATPPVSPPPPSSSLSDLTAPEETSPATPPRPPGPIVYEMLRQDARAPNATRQSENPYMSRRAPPTQSVSLTESLANQHRSVAVGGEIGSYAERQQSAPAAAALSPGIIDSSSSWSQPAPSVYANMNRDNATPSSVAEPVQQEEGVGTFAASTSESDFLQDFYLVPVDVSMSDVLLRSAQTSSQPAAATDPSSSSPRSLMFRPPSYEESMASDASSVALSPISPTADLSFEAGSSASAAAPGYDAPPAYVSERLLELNANTPLKSRQVRQLQEEMGSSAGIRVQLDKTQCAQALALVDAFGRVWVAGWNRRAYPMLQASFHIGDQLLSINDKPVSSAKSAMKILKSCADKVAAQLLLRRLPAAYVCLLRRDDSRFESLGLRMVGGTAEISDVDTSGIAAEHGLPESAAHPAGNGQCNWWITEVNHRSLNLFYRDKEAVKRLSAAGSHLSFVAQPAPLIIEMKRRLKTMKYFKDYLIE